MTRGQRELWISWSILDALFLKSDRETMFWEIFMGLIFIPSYKFGLILMFNIG
jgi:hypothetical protein